MSYACGTTTFGSTGSKTFTTSFQPTWVRVHIGALFGGAETSKAHGSTGMSDGTHQQCLYWYDDSTKHYCDNSSSKIVSHWENVSGTMTEALSATFTSFNATNVTFNCTIANANYQIFVECGT